MVHRPGHIPFYAVMAIGAVPVVMLVPITASHAHISSPSSKGLPSQMWNDVKAVTVHCHLNGGTEAQQEVICQRLLAAAQINAPVDVRERGATATRSESEQLGKEQTAHEMSLILNGTVNGSDFIGTVGLIKPALRGESDDASSVLPVTIDLNDKGSRADRSLHAAMVRLLPWRQLKRATHSPPREY